MTYIGEFSLENLVPGVKNHGVNTNEPMDFSGSPSTALPLNTTVGGNPIGGTTLASINFGAIEGFDPLGTTQGNWHPTFTLSASPQTISTGFTNPAKPRTVFVNDQNSTGSGIFTVHGTDAVGSVISDTADISQGGTTLKAFATITSVDCPASNGNNFDISTAGAVGLTATHTNPFIFIPVDGTVSQITNGGLQNGWTMTANINASVVSLNQIPIGTVGSSTFVFIIYIIAQ